MVSETCSGPEFDGACLARSASCMESRRGGNTVHLTLMCRHRGLAAERGSTLAALVGLCLIAPGKRRQCVNDAYTLSFHGMPILPLLGNAGGECLPRRDAVALVATADRADVRKLLEVRGSPCGDMVCTLWWGRNRIHVEHLRDGSCGRDRQLQPMCLAMELSVQVANVGSEGLPKGSGKLYLPSFLRGAEMQNGTDLLVIHELGSKATQRPDAAPKVRQVMGLEGMPVLLHVETPSLKPKEEFLEDCALQHVAAFSTCEVGVGQDTLTHRAESCLCKLGTPRYVRRGGPMCDVCPQMDIMIRSSDGVIKPCGDGRLTCVFGRSHNRPSERSAFL